LVLNGLEKDESILDTQAIRKAEEGNLAVTPIERLNASESLNKFEVLSFFLSGFGLGYLGDLEGQRWNSAVKLHKIFKNKKVFSSLFILITCTIISFGNEK
jgi:hypothetical protein